MNSFLPFGLGFALCSCLSLQGQDINDIGLKELSQNSLAEMESGNFYSDFGKARPIRHAVLGWYREKDARPLFIDCALVWLELDTAIGKRWAIVQMARIPMNLARPMEQHWHSYMVFDGDDGIAFFTYAPTNQDLLRCVHNFKFKPEAGWVRYSSFVDAVTWHSLLGSTPIPF